MRRWLTNKTRGPTHVALDLGALATGDSFDMRHHDHSGPRAGPANSANTKGALVARS